MKRSVKAVDRFAWCFIGAFDARMRNALSLNSDDANSDNAPNRVDQSEHTGIVPLEKTNEMN
jgi:hypothetical protein